MRDLSDVDDYGEADSTMSITRRIFQLSSRDMDPRVTSAIPDGENLARGAPTPAETRDVCPISSILGYSLPSRPVMELLLEEYFDSVHWFSLVIYEPLFRKEYNSIADGFASQSQKGFLTLLTVVLGMAAWYRSQRNAAEEDFPGEDFGAWSSELLRQTELRLFDLMNDAFASITYGRPLGINERDCNVSMPSNVFENPLFKREHANGNDLLVHYSAYQCELNKLYRISSPMIEIIFGARGGDVSATASQSERFAVVADIDQQLRNWRLNLPAHLVLDLNNDSRVDSLAETRAHRLQALSLELTYENIVIVLHRPFFAQQVNNLTRVLPGSLQGSISSPYTVDTPQSMAMPNGLSSETWWNAAVRTSRVTELPNLAQLATETHLVAFMAINLFNSAIVMVVCALSEPLSDRAQEAKRNITRIYRLLELLGSRSKLSMQSSVILQDMIRVLLNREAEAMLTSVVMPPPARSQPELDPSLSMASHGRSRTVEDALRLPLDMSSSAVDSSEVTGDAQAEHLRDAARMNGGLASIQRGIFCH
ncbi:hypothetical protein SLS57_000940 [Botryosphaeria dothidea]